MIQNFDIIFEEFSLFFWMSFSRFFRDFSSKFRVSSMALERCCVLLIFSCFFVTFSAMVFEVFVQEKVRSTWRLVEVACFSRCPARFFASFPALSKAKIDGNDFKSAKFAVSGQADALSTAFRWVSATRFGRFGESRLVNLVIFGEFW